VDDSISPVEEIASTHHPSRLHCRWEISKHCISLKITRGALSSIIDTYGTPSLSPNYISILDVRKEVGYQSLEVNCRNWVILVSTSCLPITRMRYINTPTDVTETINGGDTGEASRSMWNKSQHWTHAPSILVCVAVGGYSTGLHQIASRLPINNGASWFSNQQEALDCISKRNVRFILAIDISTYMAQDEIIWQLSLGRGKHKFVICTRVR